MNLIKQGQLITELFTHELIEHVKLVLWVDDLIAKGDIAEDWMIDISLSNETDREDLVDILQRKFGFDFHWPFTEYIAIVTFLYSIKGLPIDHCVIHLSFVFDNFKISDDDSESIAAGKIVSDLFYLLDNDGDYGKGIEQSAVEMGKLAAETQAKYKETIDFIRTYT